MSNSPLMPFGARRQAGILLGAWFAIFGINAASAAALAGNGPSSWRNMFVLAALLAVVWSVLSVAIAAWHGFLRTPTRSLAELVVAHVPGLVLVGLVDCFVTRYALQLLSGSPLRTPFSAMLLFYGDFYLVSYLAVVLAAEVLRVGTDLAKEEHRALLLKQSLGRARLDYLEAQLQPHFIFNSLGTVSELAFESPNAAHKVLQQLIAIFRTAVANKTDLVSLSEEIAAVEPYIEIQRIRFADWLQITFSVEPPAGDFLLPRFVLQPLIENAIRHGLSGRIARGAIQINGSIRGDDLVVRVADDGVGLRAVGEQSTRRGIGLANVRHRLEILYGSASRLDLYPNGSSGAVAELRIPRQLIGPYNQMGNPSIQLNMKERRINGSRFQLPTFLRSQWVAIVAIWSVCGLLWTQQTYGYLAMRGHLNGQSWLSLLTPNMTSALLWGMLTPAVIWLGRAVSTKRPRWGVRALALGASGVGVALLHVSALQRLAAPEIPLFSPFWQGTFMVDLVIFALLVAVGHRALFMSWLHESEATASTLIDQLAKAEVQAQKVRGIPPILMNCLESVERTIDRDPIAAERQLSRLADYLRLALRCTDEREVTPAREAALADALSGLQRVGAFSAGSSFRDQCSA